MDDICRPIYLWWKNPRNWKCFASFWLQFHSAVNLDCRSMRAVVSRQLDLNLQANLAAFCFILSLYSMSSFLCYHHHHHHHHRQQQQQPWRVSDEYRVHERHIVLVDWNKMSVQFCHQSPPQTSASSCSAASHVASSANTLLYMHSREHTTRKQIKKNTTV